MRDGADFVNGMSSAERPSGRGSPIGEGATIVLIDPRTLERECFVASVEAGHRTISIEAYASLAAWRADDGRLPGVAIVAIGGRRMRDESTAAEVGRAIGELSPAPVMVLGEDDTLAEMLKALDLGAKGYIPSSLGFDVAMKAVSFVTAGGVFLPAQSVLSARSVIETKPAPLSRANDMFSARQAAVVESLRKGKSNKIIAYELNMCENTVKAHVRTIMKKLQARNRTEAAFKISTMLGDDAEAVSHS